MTRSLLAVLLTLLPVIAAVPARAALIADGRFESTVLAADSYCITYAAPLCPAVTGWTGNFYLVNGTPVQITPALPLPDGLQVALVQTTNSMYQAVTIPVAGMYQLSWSDAGRANYIGALGNESYDVLFDGNVLGSYHRLCLGLCRSGRSPGRHHSLAETIRCFSINSP